MATPEQATTLAEQLRARGTDVLVLPHDGGHTIDPRTLPRIAEFVQGEPRHQ